MAYPFTSPRTSGGLYGRTLGFSLRPGVFYVCPFLPRAPSDRADPLWTGRPSCRPVPRILTSFGDLTNRHTGVTHRRVSNLRPIYGRRPSPSRDRDRLSCPPEKRIDHGLDVLSCEMSLTSSGPTHVSTLTVDRTVVRTHIPDLISTPDPTHVRGHILVSAPTPTPIFHPAFYPNLTRTRVCLPVPGDLRTYDRTLGLGLTPALALGSSLDFPRVLGPTLGSLLDFDPDFRPVLDLGCSLGPDFPLVFDRVRGSDSGFVFPPSSVSTRTRDCHRDLGLGPVHDSLPFLDLGFTVEPDLVRDLPPDPVPASPLGPYVDLVSPRVSGLALVPLSIPDRLLTSITIGPRPRGGVPEVKGLNGFTFIRREVVERLSGFGNEAAHSSVGQTSKPTTHLRSSSAGTTTTGAATVYALRTRAEDPTSPRGSPGVGDGARVASGKNRPLAVRTED